MSDLPTSHAGVESLTLSHDDGYETARQVNVGPKTNKGGDAIDPLPNTDDNMFFASGPDERMIRAKRSLRDRLNSR